MNTLDDQRPMIDETTVPFLPTAIRYGVIGGMASIAFALIGNLTGLSNPSNMMSSMVMGGIAIIITILIGYFTIRQHRENELGGYISFGRAFLVGFIALMVATVLGTLFNILYMTVIDPGFVEEILAGSEEMLANFGVPEDQMEEQMEAMRERFTTSGLLMQGFVWGPIIVAVIELIQAAIMKKVQPLS